MRIWAGAVITLLGAVVGLALWLILWVATSGNTLMTSAQFSDFLVVPEFYWPFPVLGAIIAALSFVARELLKKSN